MKTRILLTMLLGAIVALSSCSIENKICSKPSRKEINKAMSYSDWRYVMPCTSTKH